MIQSLPQHNSQYYIANQKQFESNARTYPRRLPLAIRKAKGLYVTDTDGKVYMDCLCGAGTLALGHNHPATVDAIRAHLDEGYPLHTLDLTTPVKDAFVEELFASLPPNSRRGRRFSSAARPAPTASKPALKLVKTATGRRSILAFQGGYHGQTHGTLALMGNLGPKTPITGLMPDVHFLPYPYAYRCPPGSGAYDAQYGADHIEYLLDDPESGIPHPAAMILEVVQGEGGSIPAPDEWLREIRRITRERNIPLILDEVQTGWGRTGKLYAFEHAGDRARRSGAVEGDRRKPAVVGDRLRQEPRFVAAGAHTGTFRGNQLAMSAGLATLRYLIENDIPAHADRMGWLLRDRLEEMQMVYPFLGDVRGRGLMVGVEVVDPGAHRPVGPSAARRKAGAADPTGVLQTRADSGGRRTARERAALPAAADRDRDRSGRDRRRGGRRRAPRSGSSRRWHVFENQFLSPNVEGQWAYRNAIARAAHLLADALPRAPYSGWEPGGTRGPLRRKSVRVRRRRSRCGVEGNPPGDRELGRRVAPVHRGSLALSAADPRARGRGDPHRAEPVDGLVRSGPGRDRTGAALGAVAVLRGGLAVHRRRNHDAGRNRLELHRTTSCPRRVVSDTSRAGACRSADCRRKRTGSAFCARNWRTSASRSPRHNSDSERARLFRSRPTRTIRCVRTTSPGSSPG